ncbi:MAG: TonB-dependent receptor [Rikenellaceae bacterium]|nr:TonB-dependent receptor [Rikenellaceae bacterium]
MKKLGSLKTWTLIVLCFPPLVCLGQAKAIRGVVTGTDQAPLPGVNIMIDGTNTGTITDAGGRYTIDAAPSDRLVFSFLGFEPATETVGDRTEINVVLREEQRVIDDVIVVGYGTVKKQDLTGSISSIGNKELKNYPATNFQEMLVGRVAGVEATMSSGKPGDVAQVRIRGIGTVNGTSPLYVVDGVPLNQTVDIDPRSIESMQILKDASATAIYGSRGSNGVILITTKKGQAGKISVSLDAYLGFSYMTVKHKQANSQQLYDFYLEANANDGTTPDPLVKRQYDKGYNTNWLDLATRTGVTQNYSLFVSGGTDKVKSSLQVGYIDELGTMRKNDLNKITARNTNEYQPASWLRLGNTLGVGYYKIENSLATLDVLLSADPFTPVINPLADPADPNYRYNKYAPTEFSYNTNPMSLLSQSNAYETEFNPFGSVYADVRLFDGLYFKSQAAFEKKNYETKNFEPYYRLTPSPDDVAWNTQKYRDINRISMATSGSLYLNFEQTLRYEKTFGKHSVNAVAGLTYEKWSETSLSGSRTGLPSNDDIFWTLDAATGDDDVASGGMNKTAIVSYLGRVNYAYAGRYLVTASFRADGSSEFAPGNRWGYFPSFSLGWNISEERFMRPLVERGVISQLKLRAGWGATGNKSAAARSQIVSLMGTDRGVNYGFGTDKSASPLIAVYPKSRGNSLLRWETGQQYNIGLDLSLLRRTLEINLDVYRKYTNDMILTIDLPIYAQFPSSPKANMGSMKSNGVDLTISYNNHAGDFTYGVNANLSAYKSVVRSLGGNPEYWSGDVSRSVIGEEFGRFYVLQYLGIFQNQREIDMYVDKDGRMIQPLAKPGDFKFADLDGDGQITDKDRTFIGKPQPAASFGINLTAGWKGLDISLFFTGVVGNRIFNQPKAFYGKLQKNNILQDLYENSWRREGDQTKYPRITSTDLNNNFRYSSWYLEKGSYVKLRNVQIGYSLPQAWLRRTKVIQGLRVYVSGQNLCTFTKYTGFDPEVGFNGIEDPRRYIPARMIIVGLNIQF